MSADLLLRAVDEIEFRAAHSTPATWAWDESDDGRYRVAWLDERQTLHVIAEEPGTEVGYHDMRWIAAFGPQVAPVLASWLRAVASYLPQVTEGHRLNDADRSALAFARLILGENKP